MNTETAKPTVLIIDDDRLLCEMASEFLSGAALKVLTAHTGREGLALCSQNHIDIVLLDQKLPDGEGYDLCPRIINFSENAKIIFITAFPSFKNALKAIESGAFSYLTKPFELKELKLAIDKCLRVSELEKAEASLHYQHDKEAGSSALVGEKGSMASISKLIETAAKSEAPVLITGETGSGKSRIAKLIHMRGNRRGPFMVINCAALPENLIESELFGYEKGAFSGAHTVKKGLLEIAENGSILLDEIGEMGFHLQAKLLGVLDDMQVRRVGGVISHPVQVRIMAATNSALDAKIKNREFREDLYYRLNVLRLQLPPLRDRKEDIPGLTKAFLAEMAPQRKMMVNDADLKEMLFYPWPGNVRELRNVIERAVIHAGEGNELHVSPLLPGQTGIHKDGEPLSVAETILPLAEMERRHIDMAIKKFHQNYTRTAKALGISLNTLKKKAPKS
ncbi:MAG: sigma-54-dependent Fis family transcriptional regulator [Chrysiogenales bacterium]|nr:MAG: sigma-54-dependent Fis family transcriptional regulator [Chrysiogenales bacterium]